VTIPGTWTRGFQQGRLVADQRRGNIWIDGYYAPLGTTRANALSAVAFGTAYTGETGVFASTMRRVAVYPDQPDGRVLVVFEYEPPTVREVLEKTPEAGILEVDFTSRVFVRTETLDGTPKPITKVFIYDDSGTDKVRRWHVVTGDPTAIVSGVALFRLNVTLTSLPTATIMGLIGKVNTAETVGGAAAGTMLFMPPQAKQIYYNQSLFLCRFHLAYNPTGWNAGDVVTELQELKITEQPVLDNAGNATGRSRDVETWEAVSGTDRVNCVVYGTASFAALDAYLA